MFLLLVIAISSLRANAISVASDYLVNGTLELAEGASKIYGIRLQNPTDSEANVKLDYDRDIMQVIDYKEVYTLPPKTTGYGIFFNVTAPNKPGLYIVGYTVSEVEPATGSGGVPIRLKISKNIKLKVIEGASKTATETGIAYADAGQRSNKNYKGALIIGALLVVLFAAGIVLFKQISGRADVKKAPHKRNNLKNNVRLKK